MNASSNDAQALYTQLGRLVETMPDLHRSSPDAASAKWLGQAYALVAQVSVLEAKDLAGLSHKLSTPNRFSAAGGIQLIIYRALALAEAEAPHSSQGAFIPAGNHFDAMAAIAKVLSRAKRDVLIVDPYMDEKVLTDFAVLAPEAVSIRLLGDDKTTMKATLKPARERWSAQFASRPLEVKLAPPRALHDRLIVVDTDTVWLITQSLKDFAKRSPASIVRVDDRDLSSLKVSAYGEIWERAAVF